MSSQELNGTILKNSANLKAYYRFESGALVTDSSGNGKTLTNNNTATETTGKFAGGVAVNGTNQSLTIAENLGIDGGAVTLSLWLKTTTVTSGLDHLSFIALHSATSDVSYNISVGGIGLRASRLKTGVAWQDTSEKAISSGVWTHAALTYDTTNVRLYVNGEHIGSVAASGNGNDTGSSKLAIGCRADVDALTGHIAADIDDVAVFNAALSADQVKELYEGRINGELRPNQFGTTAALYHLSSTTDGGGNNYHLTNQNTVTFSTAKFSDGANFSASNSNKALYISSNLGVTTGAISISGWIKCAAEIGSSTWTLFSHGHSTGGGNDDLLNDVLYDYNAGTRRLIFRRYTNTAEQVTYTVTLGTTNWFHLAYVYTGSAVNAYVNGNLVGTVSATSGTYGHNGGSHFLIGAGATTGTPSGGYASILADEVHVASTALTANQIRTMYAYQKGLLGRYA